MQQRHVTLTITLLANSDERAREIVDEMVMTDGAALDVEIVNVSDGRPLGPENPLGLTAEMTRARLARQLAKMDAGELIPETRRVRVMDLIVREQDLDPAALDARLRADPLPGGDGLAVVEIGERRYWVVRAEDAATARAWQLTRPNTTCTVKIIPLESDDTPEPEAP